MRPPLAVIGMACRFPGGIDTTEQFWELLRNGRDATSDIPDDRWDPRGWFLRDPERPGKSYASKGGFRTGLDLFDANFFGISPREAGRMDPQQRLLLEMAWEALEQAGQTRERLAGSDAAVIVGMSSLDYQNLQLLDPESINAYSNSGCSGSIAANRISYFFDLHGPSLILDTACSSSLVALHTACETIWSGRSRLALAGGVNVLLSPSPWVGFSKAFMLSRSGRCRVFDAAADGYVRSEGGGVLVIKPLDVAEADGDPIRAVILSSNTNCDGRTAGIFLPSAAAQTALLREAYAAAGVEPAQVSYVEAHGTGTAAGDPIECEALGAALGSGRREPLRVGSVKTNLGHLEAAAGMAGIMKVILALEHREIPATLHFETPNPRIPFAELNLEVVTRHTPVVDAGPLIMGVNSFGFGGANAHAVLREWRKPRPRLVADAPRTWPLFLSARAPEALRAAAASHADYLAGPGTASLHEICYTAAVRREHHPYRLALYGESARDMSEQLAAFAGGRTSPRVVEGKVLEGSVRPVFVFSGNGSQWPGMGRELMRDAPAFRRAVERVDREFVPLAGWSLCESLAADPAEAHLERTEVAQPLLFAVQVGLVELLSSQGLCPSAVTGHSVGEVAAAWAAGIYTLAQAVRVIHARSAAQAGARGRGRMAACGLSATQAEAAVAGYEGMLEVASINSPRSVTLSGQGEALASLGADLERQGVFFRALDLDYPFHSCLMKDARDPLLAALGELRPAPPRVPFFSTTTGSVSRGDEMDADYWWRNVRHTVLFGDAMEALIRQGYALLVEVGPHPVLRPYIRQCLEAGTATGRAVETLRRGEPGMSKALAAVGACHTSGCVLDLRAIFPESAQAASLPAYPWQRERHWCGGSFGPPRLPRGEFQHHLLGYRATSSDPLWENEIDAGEPPYLADHCVMGSTVFPGAGFAEMALKAAQLWRGGTAVAVENLEIRKAVSLSSGEPTEMQFSVCAEDASFRIRARRRGSAEWTLAAAGELSATLVAAPMTGSLDELRARLPVRVSHEEFYREFAARGLEYGPALRRIEEIRVGEGEALGRLNAPDGLAQDDCVFHPAALDACLQVSAAAAAASGAAGLQDLYLVAGIRRLRVFAGWRGAAYSYARLERRSAGSALFAICVFDAAGAVVADIEGFRVKRLQTGAPATADMPLLEMRAVPQPGRADRAGTAAVPFDRGVYLEAVRMRLADQSTPRVDGIDPRAVRAWADQVAGPGQVSQALELWRRGAAEFPAYLDECALLGRYLLARLDGRPFAPATQTLSDDAPSARAAVRAVRAAVAEFMRRWPEDRMLRILEIGGDAAALGPHILPLLDAHRSEYRYTPRDLAGQGFEERGFDLILAAGAFHRDNGGAEALARTRELGRAAGLMILVEQQPQPFFALTLGPEAQLLERQEWVRQLESSGFENVTALGDSPQGLAESNVLVAWMPADIREASPRTEALNKRTWMVLGDEADQMLGQLKARLAGAGHRVIDVVPGESQGLRCDELICGWGLTAAAPSSAEEMAAFTERTCVGALSLVQGLLGAGLGSLPRLWLLTSGAMPVEPAAGGLNPAHSPLWGLGRVLAHEIPGLATRLVDLHCNGDRAALLDRLMAEFDETGGEDETILTERARYVHRVRRSRLGERAAAEKAPESEGAFRLGLRRRGSADNLVLERCARPAPGPGQVEIRVRAAGLNFRDLMWAMNLLPEEAVEDGFAGASLGLECAGVVTRAGEGVAGLHPGDAVMAFAPRCFSRFVLADAALAFHIPSGMQPAEAATMLTAHTTAVYALEHLGHMQPGERVLIHGAAGGVGMAAIQYARHVGAEVFATAGTEEKREYLRLLGVPHVFSSRNIGYSDEVIRITGGQGVDLVLNSLTGEHVARSLNLLRPFGRFLELGKRDYYEHRRIAMAPFRNNLSYHGIDLDQALSSQAGFRRNVMSRVFELVSQGILRPLPFRVFPVSRAREAFRHMQLGQHIGKIVIGLDDDDARPAPGEDAPVALREDRSYLITGGLGGLGLDTAHWMARRGARHLVLVSRRGPTAPDAAAAVEQLRSAGCDVLAASVDVSDEEALRGFLVESSRTMPPLAGVVHSAMTLDDAMIPAMTPERFWRGARAKILGAWNLHRLTLDTPLDFFVLYSSVSATLGVPGQANYAAGNAFLESLANHRRRMGLAGTAVAWGAISDSGYLVRNPGVRETLENRVGVRSLSSRQAFQYLDQILTRDCPQWIAADFNWSKLSTSSAALLRSPRFAELVEQGTVASSVQDVEDLRTALAAMAPEERLKLLIDLLTKELARVLGSAATRLDPHRPLTELGVDSLMAVELLTAIDTRFHAPITSLEIMGGVTIAQLAGSLAAMIQAAPADGQGIDK